MATSSGTHVDAPSYFAKNGASIDALSLKQLLIPACVLNLTLKASPTYQISPDDIIEHESAHGPIPKNSLIIAYTGWSHRWSDPKTYRNVGPKGTPRFPTFGLDTIKLLLKRKIAGVAIDTLALEPLDSTFPSHKLLFSKNKYIIENIANAHKLPSNGAFVVVLPLKIEGAAEAPARVIGLILHQTRGAHAV